MKSFLSRQEIILPWSNMQVFTLLFKKMRLSVCIIMYQVRNDKV
jgi:hypothetical protein